MTDQKNAQRPSPPSPAKAPDVADPRLAVPAARKSAPVDGVQPPPVVTPPAESVSDRRSPQADAQYDDITLLDEAVEDATASESAQATQWVDDPELGWVEKPFDPEYRPVYSQERKLDLFELPAGVADANPGLDFYWGTHDSKASTMMFEHSSNYYRAHRDKNGQEYKLGPDLFLMSRPKQASEARAAQFLRDNLHALPDAQKKAYADFASRNPRGAEMLERYGRFDEGVGETVLSRGDEPRSAANPQGGLTREQAAQSAALQLEAAERQQRSLRFSVPDFGQGDSPNVRMAKAREAALSMVGSS